MNDQDPTGKD